MYKYGLDFHVQLVTSRLKAMQTLAQKALGHQMILDNFPFGDDPKSRDIRAVCEYWIEYAKLHRRVSLQQFCQHLTEIINGDYGTKPKEKVIWNW